MEHAKEVVDPLCRPGPGQRNVLDDKLFILVQSKRFQNVGNDFVIEGFVHVRSHVLSTREPAAQPDPRDREDLCAPEPVCIPTPEVIVSLHELNTLFYDAGVKHWPDAIPQDLTSLWWGRHKGSCDDHAPVVTQCNPIDKVNVRFVAYGSKAIH